MPNCGYVSAILTRNKLISPHVITYLTINIGLKINIVNVIALEAQKWMNENQLQIVYIASAGCEGNSTQVGTYGIPIDKTIVRYLFLVISWNICKREQTFGFTTFGKMRSMPTSFHVGISSTYIDYNPFNWLLNQFKLVTFMAYFPYIQSNSSVASYPLPVDSRANTLKVDKLLWNRKTSDEKSSKYICTFGLESLDTPSVPNLLL